MDLVSFFFSSRRRHTRCALVTGVQTCALPISALRIALVQALSLGTPPHAAISTVLPLVDGGPRKLVHGVFGALMRAEARLPDLPTLPDAVALRWHGVWGEAMVAAAARAIAAPPPLDLSFQYPAHTLLAELHRDRLPPRPPPRG